MKKYSFREFIIIIVEIVILYLIVSRGGAVFIDRLTKDPSLNFQTLLMLDFIKKAAMVYFAKITGDSPFYTRAFIILKGGLLLIIFARLAFVMIMHNTRENTLVLFVLMLLKMLLIFVFLFTGVATILGRMADNAFWDFGNLFTPIAAEKYLQTKNLLILIVFGLAVYDFLIFHNNPPASSTPPPPPPPPPPAKK